jgi:hypothetical protein
VATVIGFQPSCAIDRPSPSGRKWDLAMPALAILGSGAMTSVPIPCARHRAFVGDRCMHATQRSRVAHASHESTPPT